MMEQLTDHQYEVLTVPEEAAANCVYIKGVNATNFLLHRHAEECPDSVSVSTLWNLAAPVMDFINWNRLKTVLKWSSVFCGVKTLQLKVWFIT